MKNKRPSSISREAGRNQRGEMNSVQPLYIQLRDILRDQILSGAIAPHERVPSESELAQSFGVSRITVRQALRELQTAGFLFTVQGKGTFASKPKAVQNVERLQGFEEAMSTQGYHASARVVRSRECRPSGAVRAALLINPDDSVVEVKRVRYLDRVPVSVDLSYFPLDIGRRLMGHDLTHDIFSLLENTLAITLGSADIKVGTRLADADQQKLLEMSEGEPVLLVERLTLDVKGRPIDFEYLAYRGDAYQYQLRIRRN